MNFIFCRLQGDAISTKSYIQYIECLVYAMVLIRLDIVFALSLGSSEPKTSKTFILECIKTDTLISQRHTYTWPPVS